MQLLIDLTTTTHADGRLSGAARVESEFARYLLSVDPDALPVTWSADAGRLVLLSREEASACTRGVLVSLATSRPSLPPPSPGHRRILLVTGAGWLSNVACLHGLLAEQRAGSELHVVVHDLIHLLFPHWTSSEDSARFGSTLEAMVAAADRVLVYSGSTARDLEMLCAERSVRTDDVARVALGTALLDDGIEAEEAAPEVQALAGREFALYVSSIAKRKNHEFLAHVWGRLVRQHGRALPRLVLAGRAAYDQVRWLEQLYRDPALADHLVHLTSATDADLRWLYRHCAFTVFPSLYEGWGLPVAESLSFGKVCLATNASSVPEVTCDATPLLDPLDAPAWCAAVTELLDFKKRGRAEARVRERYRPTTWGDAAESLRTVVARPLVSRSQAIALDADGIPVDVHTPGLAWVREPSRLVRRPDGAVVGSRARLGIGLAGVPQHGARVTLAFDAVTTPTSVETEVDGDASDACVLAPGSPTARSVDVPRDVLLRRGFLEIVSTVRTDREVPAPPLLRHVALRPLTADEEAAVLAARRHVWRLGAIIQFGGGSPHLPMLRQGWGEPGPWGVWTIGAAASLSFRPVPLPITPLVLRAQVRGFVTAAHPVLDVHVVVGDTRLDTWTFRHPRDFGLVERTIVVPARLVANGMLDVSFEIRGCRSPRELGLSQDERKLGLGLAKALCTTEHDPIGEGRWRA